MPETHLLDRVTRRAIWLIIGGVESDEAVAWACGLKPHQDLRVLQWVAILRRDLREPVDMPNDFYCDQHDGKINTAPCHSCNHPELGNRPAKFTVWGPLWDAAKLAIEERKRGDLPHPPI